MNKNVSRTWSDKLVTQLWNMYSRTYDGLLWFWPYTHLLDLVTQELDVRPGQHILDLGCGTGNVAARTLELPGSTVVAVDLSASMLRVAKKKLARHLQDHTLTLLEGDILKVIATLPSSSFDRIESVNVLYAIADQAALWREMLRVLKPGGRITVTTSVKTGSMPIIREHFQHASVTELLRPKLLGVFVIDALINLLGNTGHFAFHDEAKLRSAVKVAGGKWQDSIVCYGGPHDGVNILFSVTN